MIHEAFATGRDDTASPREVVELLGEEVEHPGEPTYRHRTCPLPSATGLW